MAGFSGAVEDGVRNLGMVISLVLALVLGYGYDSVIVGVGAFVAGTLISIIWAAQAGEAFRARAMASGDGKDAQDEAALADEDRPGGP